MKVSERFWRSSGALTRPHTVKPPTSRRCCSRLKVWRAPRSPLSSPFHPRVWRPGERAFSTWVWPRSVGLSRTGSQARDSPGDNRRDRALDPRDHPRGRDPLDLSLHIQGGQDKSRYRAAGVIGPGAQTTLDKVGEFKRSVQRRQHCSDLRLTPTSRFSGAWC